MAIALLRFITASAHGVLPDLTTLVSMPPHPQPFSLMAGRLESSLHNEFVLRPAMGEKGAKKRSGRHRVQVSPEPSSRCKANADFL
jgi:hypothetical protein